MWEHRQQGCESRDKGVVGAQGVGALHETGGRQGGVGAQRDHMSQEVCRVSLFI